MGKSAGPPTGYVSPQDQQANKGAQTRHDPLSGADQWQDQQGNWQTGAPPTPGVFQQSAEATAQANRPTQNTPFGTSSWAQDPNTGAWTQNVGFSGGLQGAMGGMQDQLSSAWGVPLDNGATARNSAENAIYGRETSRLDPQFAQREQAMNASLANQGLDPGSQASTAMRDQFGRDRTDAYSTAQQQAIMGGGAEASRQQAMDINARMAPLQGLQGLRSLLAMPGFQPGPNYLAAAQAASNYNLQNTQQQNQAFADYMSGLGDILGGGASFYNPGK